MNLRYGHFLIPFASEVIDKPCLFHCQPGTKDDYGQRAHQDLIVTRGAGFRKEKNKKKKGSYKGGEITVIPNGLTPCS